MVMREMEWSSVSPTVRLSMLNPRLLNSPDTRLRVPARFSTSADTMCCFMGLVYFETELKRKGRKRAWVTFHYFF
jgi:hypothetical protein